MTKSSSTKMPGWIKAIIIALLGIAAGLPVGILITPKTEGNPEVRTVEITTTVDTSSLLEFSKTDEAVEIDEEAVQFVDYDVKTVETVDGGQMQDEKGNALDDISKARGAYYRTGTYAEFIEDTLNKCVIEGNIYGAQCVSLGQAFWTNYAGYGLDTCGTGAARGIWDCRDKNADDSFVMITDPANIQPGDWIITNGGTWGHIAMAVGYYNNGYIAVYGENQGGVPCFEGGSQPNVINLSMRTFLGAFRPVDYIIPEPEPEPIPEAPDTGRL